MAKKAPKLKSIPSSVKMKKEEIKVDNSYNPQPGISFSESILPEVKSWKVGESYKLEIEVKMTGSRISDYGHDKGEVCGEFKITKIGVKDGKAS